MRFSISRLVRYKGTVLSFSYPASELWKPWSTPRAGRGPFTAMSTSKKRSNRAYESHDTRAPDPRFACHLGEPHCM